MGLVAADACETTPLASYAHGDVVFARASSRATETLWPAVVVEPWEAPEGVRKRCERESVCVMFLGPSATRGRERDYCWATEARLAPYARAEALFAQKVAKRMRPSAFNEACAEARELVEANGGDASLGPRAFIGDEEDENLGGVRGDQRGGLTSSASVGFPGVPVGALKNVKKAEPEIACGSCGVTGDEGLKSKNAQGRCSLCQKLYKEGQFCPVCDRVWQWATGDPMVGCDRCDMWIHRECDALAAEVLDREENDGEELAYECPKCRMKTPAQIAEEERRAEAARIEAKRKAEIKERKRLEKLLAKPRVGRPSRAVKEARLALKRLTKSSFSFSPGIKSPHAVSKKQNTVPKRPKSSWQLFAQDFFQNYKDENVDDTMDFAEIYRMQGAAWRDLPTEERERYEDLAREEAGRFRELIMEMYENGDLDEQQQKRYDKVLHPERYEAAQRAKAERGSIDANRAARRSKAGEISKLTGGSDLPATLAVVCNGVAADYYTRLNQVLCQCSECAGEQKYMTPTEFEKHAGMAQAKKWKASLRMVEPAKMPIGRFLDGSDFNARRSSEDDSSTLDYDVVKVSWSVDRCAVCDDERDFDYDQLITCEACAVTVHQSCYGVPDIPDDTVGWLCRACEHTGGAVSETPLCCLCPVEGGALKPTTIPSLWAHSACCQWIPETTVLDIERMEPIDNIANIQKERWTLLCTVCKQRMGAKIQCCHPGCYIAYHPLCARATGLYMDANDDGEDDDSPLQLLSYCHRHCRVDTERAQIYAGDKGLRIGQDGRLIQCGANTERKQTKAERRAAQEAKEREEAAVQIAEESELSSDSEYDWTQCAKFRTYVPVGHPRTEADIKDDDEDVPGSAAKKIRVRKRVLHADEDDDADADDQDDDQDDDDDDDGDGGGDDDDDDDDDDGDDDKIVERMDTDKVDTTIVKTNPEAPVAMELDTDDEDLSTDLDVKYNTEPTDHEEDDPVADSELPTKVAKVEVDIPRGESSKRKADDLSESSPKSTTFGLPKESAPAATSQNAAQPCLPGGLPVPEGNVPRPELPETLVRCKTFRGIFRPADTYIKCLCGRCKREAELAKRDEPALWEANRWEAHAGMKHTKKWKISIRIAKEDENEDNDDDQTFGDWLDAHGVVVLANKDKAARTTLNPPKPQKLKKLRGTSALKDLGLGTFEDDKLGDRSEEKTKAHALVGRRVQIDHGTVHIPDWRDGSIMDCTISRTGIRYKVIFDDGTDQLMSFTRDAQNLKFLDGEAPDLTFLPEAPKANESRNTQAETQIAIANAQYTSAKRPADPSDRAKIADLARPKKPREKEAWVQCENASCGKWRRVPQSFAEKLSADDADMWTCQKNPMAAYAVCSIPQEFEDDEIDRRIALGDDAPYMEGSDDEESDDDEDAVRTHVPDDLPAMVSVVCRGVLGTYHVQTRRIECLCRACVDNDDGPVYHERTKFEAHVGLKGPKRWAQTIRVVLNNRTLISLGKWLETWGCEVRREKAAIDLSATTLSHHSKLTRKQLEEIQANVYKRLGLDKHDKNAKVTGPPPKTGKRLYVELTPYIVRGSRGAIKGELISSKKYTPDEFAALQAERKARGSAGASEDKIVEQQGMTMREKLEHMTATYSDRLTFCKSNIHGWGLLAKTSHKAGSIVTEFKGETCRSTVADMRETAYEEEGVDCYLLKQDDDTVVDCTFQGNLARFTNHSCNPNMYSKIVKVDGENHIIFFARNDIKAGEELTYNYRFESEDGKVPCYCGAHNCRGYLC